MCTTITGAIVLSNYPPWLYLNKWNVYIHFIFSFVLVLSCSFFPSAFWLMSFCNRWFSQCGINKVYLILLLKICSTRVMILSIHDWQWSNWGQEYCYITIVISCVCTMSSTRAAVSCRGLRASPRANLTHTHTNTHAQNLNQSDVKPSRVSSECSLWNTETQLNYSC